MPRIVFGPGAPGPASTRRWLLSIVASLTVVFAGLVAVAAATPAQAAALRPPGVVYRSAVDGLLWEVGPDGQAVMAGNGLGVSPGTTPVVAALSNGGRVIAFHAWGIDTLWWIDENNVGHDSKIKMWPGTSPAIAANHANGWQVAFEADTSRLWTLSTQSGLVETASAMLNGPNAPSIAALSDNTFETAFLASDATLWVQNSAAGGYRVTSQFQPGASPSIAAGADGGWKIAIQADDTREWTVTSAGQAVKTSSSMMPGTSPAITGLPTGGYVQAFVASSGELWLEDSGGNGHSTRLAVASGTSPAIVVDSSGRWETAFLDNTRSLTVIDNTEKIYDTYQTVSDGNSPDLDATLPNSLPFFTQSPSCGCTAPTAGLTSLANNIRVRMKSVTGVVKVPAGLPVTNPTEIHIQAYDGGSTVQPYSAAGNNVVLQYPANDGKLRLQNLDITLTEKGKKVVSYHFTVVVTIEPIYSLTLSPLTFKLLNQCDTVFGQDIDLDDEVRLRWTDDRGEQHFDISDLQPLSPRSIAQFARVRPEARAADGMKIPGFNFTEFDVDGTGFSSTSIPGAKGPLLGGTSHHVDVDGVSVGPYPDGGCHGRFSYDVTIVLRTYPAK